MKFTTRRVHRAKTRANKINATKQRKNGRKKKLKPANGTNRTKTMSKDDRDGCTHNEKKKREKKPSDRHAEIHAEIHRKALRTSARSSNAECTKNSREDPPRNAPYFPAKIGDKIRRTSAQNQANKNASKGRKTPRNTRQAADV